MTYDKKARINEVVEKLGIQSVGYGYINCICPIPKIRAFIDAMRELNVKITGFTW